MFLTIVKKTNKSSPGDCVFAWHWAVWHFVYKCRMTVHETCTWNRGFTVMGARLPVRLSQGMCCNLLPRHVRAARISL